MEGINSTSFFTRYDVSNETVFYSLFYIILGLYGFLVPSLFIAKKKINILSSNSGDLNIRIKPFENLSLILSPVVVIGIIFKIKFILEFGYIAYHQGLEKIPYNSVFEIVSGLYLITIVARVFQYKSTHKPSFWIHFTILSLALLADGRRGPFLLFFINSIYHLQKHVAILNLKKIFLIGFTLIFSVIGIGNLRYNKVIENISLVDFLFGQGISLQTIFYSIEYDEMISYSPLNLFDSIIRLIKVLFNKIVGNYQNLTLDALISENKIYSSYLSSIVNYDLFESGFGMGGSYIAELYSAGGGIAILLGSFLMGTLFIYLLRIQSKTTYLHTKILTFILISSILYLPRDNMLDLFTENLIAILLIGIMRIMSLLKFKLSS